MADRPTTKKTSTAQTMRLAAVFDSRDDAAIRLINAVLPYSMMLVVDVIGLRQTLALMDSFSGQIFVMPRCPRGAGVARFRKIEQVIGIDSALQMSKHLGGKKLSIPCMKVLRRVLTPTKNKAAQ